MDRSHAVRLKASQFGSTQQTPILYQGHLFGIRQRDKELVCLDLAGKEVWHSGGQAPLRRRPALDG